MVIETAVELYRFTCAWCGRVWTAHYHVQEFTGHDGESWSLHRHGGLPCEAPAAAATICTTCHRAPVQVTLLSRRDAPPTG